MALVCLEHLPAQDVESSQLCLSRADGAVPPWEKLPQLYGFRKWGNGFRVHLQMGCIVNYFSGTGSLASAPPGKATNKNRAAETLPVSTKPLIPTETRKSFQDTRALDVLFFKFSPLFFKLAVKVQLNSLPGTLLTGKRFFSLLVKV